MELPVMLQVGGSASPVTVSDVLFGAMFNEGIVHQSVTAYLAGARAGTKAQKTRSEVSGGGIKPWRQKGTGRARAGTIRSPLWRKGGVIFAAKPRDYTQKVNKKMYRVSMASIFSELVRQNRFQVLDTFQIETPKTRDLVAKLKQMDLTERTLILVEDWSINLLLAARNLPNVWVLTADTVDPVSLVAVDKVMITVPALRKLEERFA
ncbi:MAG: 50S ribosomal protein L4 [Gammaproteobacteria bacterium RIFCSPHIGHO2_12_FULL_45_9]|nr:MAG: 50S ribosomal protein L4 [Gammaproteobacteria bacterium RIFCSPHIGHO2_12_FULL_45_9]